MTDTPQTAADISTQFKTYLLDLQSRIVTRMEALDGKPFLRDAWVRGPEERLQGEGSSTDRKSVV